MNDRLAEMCGQAGRVEALRLCSNLCGCSFSHLSRFEEPKLVCLDIFLPLYAAPGGVPSTLRLASRLAYVLSARSRRRFSVTALGGARRGRPGVGVPLAYLRRDGSKLARSTGAGGAASDGGLGRSNYTGAAPRRSHSRRHSL